MVFFLILMQVLLLSCSPSVEIDDGSGLNFENPVLPDIDVPIDDDLTLLPDSDITLDPGLEMGEVDVGSGLNFKYHFDVGLCIDGHGNQGHNQGVVECGLVNESFLKDLEDSKKSLFGINFSGLSLQSIDFQSSQLQGAQYSQGLLSDVNFMGANLTDSKFDEAELNRVIFFGATLEDADFSDSVIHESDLSDIELYNDLIEKGIEIGLDNQLPELIEEIETILAENDGDDRDIASDESSSKLKELKGSSDELTAEIKVQKKTD